ncbi:MAG: Wzz/FepE/Etk N-terminal domain-containing protein [Pseudomonas sp.]
MRNNRERLSSTDEVGLYEVVQGLERRRFLILAVTVLVFLCVVAYAYLATPQYEAKIFVAPPSQNSISQLNYGRGAGTGLETIKVADVYGVYQNNLRSESLRRRFFRTVYLPTLDAEQRSGSQDKLYERFSKMLVVEPLSKDASPRYSITATLSDPAKAAEWVRLYASMAGDWGREEILKDLKSDVTVKISNLQKEIDGARESAKKQREDQIAQLQEALVVANSIGLEKPPIISGVLASEVSAGMDGALTYMRGSKALESEIHNLQSRVSDDPFIKNLRQQQSVLWFYSRLEIDPAVISVYRQDGAIDMPDEPVKPNKPLVLVLGGVVSIVLGLLAGLMAYLWHEGVARRRVEHRDA